MQANRARRQQRRCWSSAERLPSPAVSNNGVRVWLPRALHASSMGIHPRAKHAHFDVPVNLFERQYDTKPSKSMYYAELEIPSPSIPIGYLALRVPSTIPVCLNNPSYPYLTIVLSVPTEDSKHKRPSVDGHYYAAGVGRSTHVRWHALVWGFPTSE